jgi:hypothetical protein
MTAYVLQNYLRNDRSVEGFETEDNDPIVQSHYFTTFRRLRGNASEEATSVRENIRITLKMLGQYLGNWKQ